MIILLIFLDQTLQELNHSAVMISIIATVIAMVQVVYICSREAIMWQKQRQQEREQNERQHQQEVEQQRSRRDPRHGIEVEESNTPVILGSPQRQHVRMEVQPPCIPMQPLLHRVQVHA
jgi:beta-lactamase regulating signal transducer with metallopeptidase domain